MSIPSSKIVYLSLAAVVGTFAALVASGCDSDASSDATVDFSECQEDAYGKDMDTGNDIIESAIDASVDGDDIVITLDDYEANCCPSPGATITFDSFDIHVDFQEITADEACNCMCVIDFEVRIPDVAPGDYTIDFDYDGADHATLEVTVP